MEGGGGVVEIFKEIEQDPALFIIIRALVITIRALVKMRGTYQARPR